MALPTASEVTELFLYGSGGKPSDLVSETLIRSADATSSITVNVTLQEMAPHTT